MKLYRQQQQQQLAEQTRRQKAVPSDYIVSEEQMFATTGSAQMLGSTGLQYHPSNVSTQSAESRYSNEEWDGTVYAGQAEALPPQIQDQDALGEIWLKKSCTNFTNENSVDLLSNYHLVLQIL